MDEGTTETLPLPGLLGAPGREVLRRLGDPEASRRAGGDRWLIYRREEGRLRVRTVEEEGDEGVRVAAWTFTWRRGRPTLREALEPLGLWPAGAPDVRASGLEPPLARRALPARAGADGHEEARHSLTASAAQGLFVRVAAFDEPPDWL